MDVYVREAATHVVFFEYIWWHEFAALVYRSDGAPPVPREGEAECAGTRFDQAKRLSERWHWVACS